MKFLTLLLLAGTLAASDSTFFLVYPDLPEESKLSKRQHIESAFGQEQSLKDTYFISALLIEASDTRSEMKRGEARQSTVTFIVKCSGDELETAKLVKAIREGKEHIIAVKIPEVDK